MTLKGEKELLEALKGIEKQLEVIAWQMTHRNRPNKKSRFPGYIDKCAVIAEIEKKGKQYANERNTITKNNENYQVLLGRIKMCDDILSFIDTLEAKDIDLNLEITLWANAIPEIQLNDVERLAKYFFELGIKAKGE